eukprot:15291478-Alexandrium_andersonii.AAC.1
MAPGSPPSASSKPVRANRHASSWVCLAGSGQGAARVATRECAAPEKQEGGPTSRVPWCCPRPG